MKTPNNISFVIQGPYFPTMEESVRDLRILFPGNEIIWAHTTERYHGSPGDIDCEIEIADPGPRNINIHRQCATTLAGIKEAKRPFVYKIRSDFKLHQDWRCSLNALRAMTYLPVNDHFKCFDNRLIVGNITTLKTRPIPSGFWHRCFNISDWFIFGHKADMRRLFESVDPNENYPDIAPEQILWTSATKHCTANQISLNHMNESSEYLCRKTEEFIISNLFVTRYIPFYSNKYQHLTGDEDQLMTENDWYEMYLEHKFKHV